MEQQFWSIALLAAMLAIFFAACGPSIYDYECKPKADFTWECD